MSSHNGKGRARVYSYLRFSSIEQKKGDSRRRQDEGAELWCKRNGHALDTALKYADDGVSGFRGVHRTKGKLGLFLKAVEAGVVHPGSILLVENLDRLGREAPSTTLRETIFKLWDHGITLQSLSPEQSYPPGCDQKPEFIVLILYLQRAWDESERKSDLAKSNWAEKQRRAIAENHIITGSVPAWIKVEYDNSDPQKPKAVGFKPIAEAVPVIRQIFEMKAGGMGYGSIVRKLNMEGAWQPPLKKGGGRRKDSSKKQATTGWRISYVKKVLVNRAVLGQYMPKKRQVFLDNEGKPVCKRIPAGDVISDYFPAIIEPDLFNAVQAVLKANHKKGGRIARAANLLAHLAKCAYCGGPMAYCDRGDRGDRWLTCDNGRNAARSEATGKPKCARYSMKYAECEKLVLSNCPELRPQEVLPARDQQKTRCQLLRQRIKAKSAEMQQIDQQAANLVDQLSRTDNATVRDRYQAKIKECDERLTALAKEKEADENELRDAEGGIDRFSAWQRNLETLTRILKKRDVQTRVNLRMHLRELIDKIEVFAVGDTGDNFREAVWNYVDEWETKEDRKALSRFIDELEARRHSREGRFLRVWFKGGGRVDLVPPGSLADGWAIGPKGNLSKAIRPDICGLWEEFQRGNERNRRKRLIRI
jgi:DNA invertase Pin-like site-specific DNA recombinase